MHLIKSAIEIIKRCKVIFIGITGLFLLIGIWRAVTMQPVYRYDLMITSPLKEYQLLHNATAPVNSRDLLLLVQDFGNKVSNENIMELSARINSKTVKRISANPLVSEAGDKLNLYLEISLLLYDTSCINELTDQLIQHIEINEHLKWELSVAQNLLIEKIAIARESLSKLNMLYAQFNAVDVNSFEAKLNLVKRIEQLSFSLNEYKKWERELGIIKIMVSPSGTSKRIGVSPFNLVLLNLIAGIAVAFLGCICYESIFRKPLN